MNISALDYDQTHLTPEQIRQVLAVLLDENHLWLRIGESRAGSFSTLIFYPGYNPDPGISSQWRLFKPGGTEADSRTGAALCRRERRSAATCRRRRLDAPPPPRQMP
jgi:hypothetical protein